MVVQGYPGRYRRADLGGHVRGLEHLLGGAVYQPGCLKVSTLLPLWGPVSPPLGQDRSIQTRPFQRIKEFSFVTVQKKETSEVIWNMLTMVSRLPPLPHSQKERSCCDLNSAARVSRFFWCTCDAADDMEWKGARSLCQGQRQRCTTKWLSPAESGCKEAE